MDLSVHLSLQSQSWYLGNGYAHSRVSDDMFIPLLQLAAWCSWHKDHNFILTQLIPKPHSPLTTLLLLSSISIQWDFPFSVPLHLLLVGLHCCPNNLCSHSSTMSRKLHHCTKELDIVAYCTP